MGGAVFLDRDGVIIEDRLDYVKSLDEVVIISSALSAIRRLTEADIPVVMVTNQSAVGRGILAAEDVEQIHDRLFAEVVRAGGRFAGVYYCPHHPEAGCDCRKPAPGMLIRAAHDLDIDLSSSVIVGDTLTDIEAGYAAGTRGILVLTGKGQDSSAKVNEHWPDAARRPHIAADIGEAVDIILQTFRG
jgi:D-glycero-D-manno-heptose 1,7-bisphosphate phosphatase